MSEFLVRTVGGPFPGDRVIRDREWPPPDQLFVPDGSGVYVKASQSEITDEQAATMTHVIRGAEYRWQPSIVDLWEVPLRGHS